MAVNIFSKNRVLLDSIAKGFEAQRKKMRSEVSIGRVRPSLPWGQYVEASASVKPGNLLDAFAWLQRDTNIVWGGADLTKVSGTWEAWPGRSIEEAYKFFCIQDVPIYYNKSFNITFNDVIAHVPPSLAQVMQRHYNANDLRSWSAKPDQAEISEFSKSELWKDIADKQSELLAKFSSNSAKFKLVNGMFSGFSADGFLPVIQVDFKKDEIRYYKDQWATGGDFKGGTNISVMGTVSQVLKDGLGGSYWRWGSVSFPIRLIEPVHESWMS